MTQNENELYELIRNIGRGIKKHGIKNVIRSLKKINLEDENDYEYIVIDIVEKSICSKIGIPRDELFGFATRGEITIARKLSMLLIRKFIENMSDESLGNHYNRTRQVVHNAEKEFKAMKSSIKKGVKNNFHSDFIKIYNELEIDITQQIKLIKK